MKKIVIVFLAVYFAAAPVYAKPITNPTAADIPTPAAQAGYKTNTFNSSFDDVDIKNTQQPGFGWYPYNFFGMGVANMQSLSISPGKSVVLNGDVTGPNGEIATATGKNGIVGIAFGGGAYFEATLSFNPAQAVSGPKGAWPSFWALPMEKITAQNQWPGQPAGYSHYIEVDFMEYCIYCTSVQSSYYATIHDWYGIYTKTCMPFCNVQNTSNIISVQSSSFFSSAHKYGALWIPATDKTSGSLQYYFDRQPVGPKISWAKYNGLTQFPASNQKPWLFGVLDQEHLVLILGTGKSKPLTVYNVQVWQANAQNNITH